MVLITLQAFDIDSENLQFSIIEGNSLGFFKINSSSGAVGLAKPLDRETEDDFLLRVFVDDGEFNVSSAQSMFIANNCSITFI